MGHVGRGPRQRRRRRRGRRPRGSGGTSSKTAPALQAAMAAVDNFYLLYREIARSCNCYMEALALVGAWYTARKSVTLVCDFYSLIRLHFIPRLVSRADLIKQYGRWAVVSGATDGIGRAYAEELASRGLNIILISRNQEKLQMVAKDIADTYRVETDIIVADFSNGREIYDPIREALKDKDIGILVNNVGVFYPYPQYFTQVSEDKLWDIINVNMAAASLMVHMVLPGMVERKKGAVVTISSGSCCKPTPQLAVFSASKDRTWQLSAQVLVVGALTQSIRASRCFYSWHFKKDHRILVPFYPVSFCTVYA
ncbi:inactive hydroxysteroid dehydrogenase-like protein 1 isoform X3 [Manis javanica]|uniref:inactive hydroxysteroid dehydrogenase-like protein 1 isoform X3 n=1 Tax=Manis javanica TaxID=9974 RepID=UPI003C6D0EBF